MIIEKMLLLLLLLLLLLHFQRRQVLGFGSRVQWTEAWKRSLSFCLSNNGVIIATSAELFSAIINMLQMVKDVPQYAVCSAVGSEPAFPTPCIIEENVLRGINMHTLFPIERPIMIVDSSPEWRCTWEWLAYLPTFHIVSRIPGGSLTYRLLFHRR